MYINARSIVKRGALACVHRFAQGSNFQIIGIVESWLNAGISDAELSCNNLYTVHRRDRATRGGGVLFLVDHSLCAVDVNIPDVDIELVCIDVTAPQPPLRLMLVYAPGTEGYQNDLSTMRSITDVLDSLISVPCPSIILGDFNCPKICWKTLSCAPGCHPKERLLLDFVILNGLSQQVESATRPASSNIVDLVLCSDRSINSRDVSTMPSPVQSDHLALSIGIHCHRPGDLRPPLPVDHHDYAHTNFIAIDASLLATNWHQFFEQSRDANDMYNRLVDYLRTLIDLHVPRRRRRDKPMKDFCTRLSQRLAACDPEDVPTVNKLQRTLNRCLLRRRRLLERDIVDSREPSRFYGYTSSMMKMRDHLSVLVDTDGSKITDDRLKAELLLNTFGATYNRVLPAASLGAVICPSDLAVIDDVDLSEMSVYRELVTMSPKKSANPEMIPAILLRGIALGLSCPLSLIFRASLDSGIVPKAFREAWISPVHKKGPRTDPNNKRPVSLTSVCSKTIERLISKAILTNAEAQGLICDQQYAYRRGRSTTDCLMRFLCSIAPHVDSRTTVDVVYTDFKSAFETMQHDTLLSVLPRKGVGPRLRSWISSFLTDRCFRVKVNDSLSGVGHPTTGCPQGTVLGSLLFLLFIDDVRHVLDGRVEYFVFADDVKMVKVMRGPPDCDALQHVLTDFAHWSMKMGLMLSAPKCGFLRIGPDVGAALPYHIDGVPLKRLTSVRDLGVFLDDSLCFSIHVRTIVSKRSTVCSWIFRSFSICDPDVYIRLFNSYVSPILEYACQVWRPHMKCDIELLSKMHRKFLRRVELRCGLLRGTLRPLPILDRLDLADLKYLRRTIRNEPLFDMLFDIRWTPLRRGFSLAPKFIPRTAKIDNLFPGRIARAVR